MKSNDLPTPTMLDDLPVDQYDDGGDAMAALAWCVAILCLAAGGAGIVALVRWAIG